ncbi:UPF0146 family protein [Halopelagius fulvigenes]|uniref:UPF0146 protein ACFQEV_17210 n=1 Tax=Halopelagius fulvigenes TaxID=1198324 RepID=A0ABD5U1P0_9EURY
METALRDALAARLARYDSLVEIGIGRAPDVAAALAAAGKDVTATDVREFDAPPGVEFVEDDVVAASERDDPGPAYRADAVYALNLPPELHRPARDVARAVGADFLFTTLGYDAPSVPAETESVGRETLYVVPAGHREPGAESQR